MKVYIVKGIIDYYDGDKIISVYENESDAIAHCERWDGESWDSVFYDKWLVE